MVGVAVYPLADDIFVISHPTREGNTIRHVNSLVIRAARPVVLDTTFPPEAAAFLEDLSAILDPAKVAFVAATHADPDHTGAIVRLLLKAPQARVLTNAVGKQKLMGDFGLPAERFLLVEPGESVDLGDRKLTAQAVPLFDQPETMGFFDDRSRVLYSSDCFGAVLEEFIVYADEADDESYRVGFQFWNYSNHPWVRFADRARWRTAVDAVRRLEPRTICSTHGPVIRNDIERVLGWVEELPDTEVLRSPFSE
jgi:flavorubredoxin